MKPVCRGCNRHPDEISEYVSAAAEYDPPVTPDQYVQIEEGTYNKETGGFLCTDCYINAGMPTAPYPGWKAP